MSLGVVVKMSRLRTSNTADEVAAVARDNDGSVAEKGPTEF